MIWEVFRRMTEIKTEQKLELNNVLSFRGKIKQAELEAVGKALEQEAVLAGAKVVGNPVSATYAVEQDEIDIELLLPIDREITPQEKYVFKKEIRIVNAAMVAYKGNLTGLQEACNELNQYMLEHKMQPITVGYNVTKYIDPMNLDNTEVEIYVGVSPNII